MKIRLLNAFTTGGQDKSSENITESGVRLIFFRIYRFFEYGVFVFTINGCLRVLDLGLFLFEFPESFLLFLLFLCQLFLTFFVLIVAFGH